MKKIISLLFIVLSSSLAAGLYGILHDLITYHISPEYYIYYKFIEFGLTDSYDQHINNPLLFVAITGFMATWWVGSLIGLAIGGLVLKFSDATARQIVFISINNTLLILAITFACGVTGWLCGTLTDSGDLLYLNDIPLTPAQARQITIVSYIHSFGYIGSVIGFVVAVMRTVKLKRD